VKADVEPHLEPVGDMARYVAQVVEVAGRGLVRLELRGSDHPSPAGLSRWNRLAAHTLQTGYSGAAGRRRQHSTAPQSLYVLIALSLAHDVLTRENWEVAQFTRDHLADCCTIPRLR
jgi:hypothetical protein